MDYGNYEEGNIKVQHEMEMVRQQTIDSAPPPGYQEQFFCEYFLNKREQGLWVVIDDLFLPYIFQFYYFSICQKL